MNVSNKYKMKKYVIGYLDLLGTKDIVKNNPEKAISDLWLLNHGVRKEYNIDKKRVVRAFTDNYLIAYEIDNNNYVSKVADVFKSIGYAIDIELVENYSLVRGAVVIGDMYIDEEMIVGSGIVNAHEIESNRCKYPRIVLDSSIRDYFDIK